MTTELLHSSFAGEKQRYLRYLEAGRAVTLEVRREDRLSTCVLYAARVRGRSRGLETRQGE